MKIMKNMFVACLLCSSCIQTSETAKAPYIVDALASMISHTAAGVAVPLVDLKIKSFYSPSDAADEILFEKIFNPAKIADKFAKDMVLTPSVLALLGKLHNEMTAGTRFAGTATDALGKINADTYKGIAKLYKVATGLRKTYASFLAMSSTLKGIVLSMGAARWGAGWLTNKYVVEKTAGLLVNKDARPTLNQLAGIAIEVPCQAATAAMVEWLTAFSYFLLNAQTDGNDFDEETLHDATKFIADSIDCGTKLKSVASGIAWRKAAANIVAQ